MKGAKYTVGSNTIVVDGQGGVTIEDATDLVYLSVEDVIGLLSILTKHEIDFHRARDQRLDYRTVPLIEEN